MLFRGAPGWLSWLSIWLFSSGHDLREVRLIPPWGSTLSRESAWDSLSLPLPSDPSPTTAFAHAFSLSQINKSLKQCYFLLEKETNQYFLTWTPNSYCFTLRRYLVLYITLILCVTIRGKWGEFNFYQIRNNVRVFPPTSKSYIWTDSK